jgi:hypothetical protein
MQFELDTTLDTHYMSTRKKIKVKKLFWFKVQHVKLLCSNLEQAQNILFKYSFSFIFLKPYRLVRFAKTNQWGKN